MTDDQAFGSWHLLVRQKNHLQQQFEVHQRQLQQLVCYKLVPLVQLNQNFRYNLERILHLQRDTNLAISLVQQVVQI